MSGILNREFYLRGANTVAPELLGKLLVHKTPEGLAAGMITELECYIGDGDDGAHSFGGRRTKRTEIQFGNGGYAYVFGIYGMHCCFNVVTNVKDKPEAILVRALEPVEGLALMKNRRGDLKKPELCNGPGKLCAALGITKAQYGLDLCGDSLYIEDFCDIPAENIALSPRINIDYAQQSRDFLWRYYIKDSAYVSKVQRRYAEVCTLDKIK